MNRSSTSGCFFALLGPAILIMGAVNVAGKYGRQWHFGRYGMPVTLIAQNGLHPDGQPVNPIVMAIVRTGYEPELHLALSLFIATCLAHLANVWRASALQEQRVRRQYQELARMRR